MTRNRDLTHVGEDGEIRMVDVSGKSETQREATASGRILMSREALNAIRGNAVQKGDVLPTAQLAGIQAAKKTSELIPLCHPVALTDVVVTAELESDPPAVAVKATTRTVGRTGVEMEAIVAVTVALATVYDMAKSIDRHMTISGVHLESKSGGRSGDWRRG